ncbi:protein NYNRIN-like [Lithobates pipiens]
MPVTLKQLRAFLGLVGYCRQFLPQYSTIIGPLQDLLKGHTKSNYKFTTEELTPAVKEAFKQIKQSLLTVPSLGLPDYSKDFYLFCTEVNGHANGVLTQHFCARHRPVGYYSYPLDSVARGLPGCLKSVAAAALLVEKTTDIVLGNDLYLMCPHDLEAMLNSAYTKHFSVQRITHYHLILLSASNLKIQRCQTLNPATFLPEDDTEEIEDSYLAHDCATSIDEVTKPRPDLLDEPISGLPLCADLFVDGSSLRRPDGLNLAACAVVNGEGKLLHAEVLQNSKSAQAAELTAICVALELAEGDTVNIYSDSAYAVGILHSFAQLWQERGYLTAAGTPIQHKELIVRLLTAVQLPFKVAVIKCKAHTRAEDSVSIGNALADEQARTVIHSYDASNLVSTFTLMDLQVDLAVLSALQDSSPHKSSWIAKGAICVEDGLWRFHGKLVAPPTLFPSLFALSHGPCHVSTGGMCRTVKKHWWAPGFHTYAVKQVQECVTCQMHNIGKPVPTPMKHIPHTEELFQIVQIDFSDMPPCGRYRYLLVCVCQFSNWVESFPTAKNDARTVVKCLTRELIPRFGIGAVISSDRGTHFDNKLMAEVVNILGIRQQLHTPYRPQASGMVERTNQTLKRYLAKITANGKSTWVEALPIALATIRTTPKEKHGLSPFDILFGRPPRRLPAPLAPPETVNLRNGQDTMIDYVRRLANVFSDTFSRAKAGQPVDTSDGTHGLKSGEWVYIKNHTPRTTLSPRWKGPFQIILVSPTAVKLKDYKYWVHGSHCKKTVAPKEHTDQSAGSRYSSLPLHSRSSPPITRARARRLQNESPGA